MIVCTPFGFAKAGLFVRKQKSEAFLLRSLLCAYKPDSVGDSHVSGIAVAGYLKRLYP